MQFRKDTGSRDERLYLSKCRWQLSPRSELIEETSGPEPELHGTSSLGTVSAQVPS